MRCREQKKHVSSRDVKTRASVQLKEMGCMRNKGKKRNVNQSVLNLSYLERGSFLMSEISKGLEKNTVTFIFYTVNLQIPFHKHGIYRSQIPNTINRKLSVE